MYMFPKFLESLPLAARKYKRENLIDFKLGHNVLFGIALAITSDCYFNHPDSIKKSIAFILNLIIGRDEELKPDKSAFKKIKFEGSSAEEKPIIEA